MVCGFRHKVSTLLSELRRGPDAIERQLTHGELDGVRIVADIQACYQLGKSRGAQFITEPKEKCGETRCYIRDPDGYIIGVGQSKPDFTYG